MATCLICSSEFLIDDTDRAYYQKINVPLPKCCPKCRQRRRLIFRNEHALYRRNCDLCKTSMITIYKPESPFTVYCQSCWWSDKWDPATYEKEYDFSRSFFEQFRELSRNVPRSALYNVNCVNSEYCQQVVDDKDCYLCFVSKGCDSCMYMGNALNDRDSLDSSYLTYSELSYECVDSDHLYNCSFCEHCSNSNDLMFCYDLSGCHNCFGCVGLRNKEYYIFNKPYSKEEYSEKIKSFELHKQSKLQEIKMQFETFVLKHPHRNLWQVAVENSTGNSIQHVMNSRECYDAHSLQDCAYSAWIFESKDSYDCYGMGGSELVYETIGDEEVQNCQFNTFVTRSSNVTYSDSCFSSHDLFGCAGMKHAQYVIFNKKYTPEEYKILTAKIRASMEKSGEFGEFFPKELSPFDYNETIAEVFMSLEKDRALAQGFTWHEEPASEYRPATYQIPDSILDAPDSIVREILACSVTGKNYKIIPQELEFYHKHGLPVPRKCPDQRHRERMQKRLRYFMYERPCMKCNTIMKTIFAPERPEIVYCEKCYLETVY
ncbi:MAG: hypothetical protein NTX63_05300 [Candidatus Peregrinibacteria bacterium]|nr:hypothetical protein [Candidatus Peregrinibacteria bacterium]